jgi:hypothetical protein
VLIPAPILSDHCLVSKATGLPGEVACVEVVQWMVYVVDRAFAHIGEGKRLCHWDDGVTCGSGEARWSG